MPFGGIPPSLWVGYPLGDDETTANGITSPLALVLPAYRLHLLKNNNICCFRLFCHKSILFHSSVNCCTSSTISHFSNFSKPHMDNFSKYPGFETWAFVH